jgi:hypothetical protein
MNKKISQFEVTTSFEDNDILTLVQDKTNKIIHKDDFETSLSGTFATNERVDGIEEDVANLDIKVDNNYTDLSNKIVEGDTNVTNNLSSNINSYYDVLNNKIITLEDKHDKDLTEVNDTVQGWIDTIDDKSTKEQLQNLLNRLIEDENIITALADLIANGGGSGEAPGFHTQPTSTIFPLSGYYYNGDTSDLTTTDTLNQALSKLEGKIRSVEGSIGGDTKYMITSTDNTQPTDGNLYSARRSDLNYISKKVDDTANGYIKFLKGIQGGQTFREGFLGEGASLYPINGRWKFEVDDLFVRGRMTVNELLVNEIKATGGDILVSVADLEILDVTTTPDNDYKCTFDTQDGTVRNPFVEGDQAICQIFDGKNVKRYWRMVSEVGTDYVVLSDSVCEPGSSVPEPKDKIIQLGNRYPGNEDRRSAIMISARGAEGPSITLYDNIDDFNLVGKDRTVIGKNSRFVGTLSQVSSNGDIIRVPIDRGQFIAGTTYYYYDRVSYNGSLWLCMATQTTSIPSKENDEWLLQVEKGEQGAAGADKAKWVEITGERLFMYDNPNFEGTPTPSVITLYCNTYNIENPVFTWVNRNTNETIGTSQALDVRPDMFGDLRNFVVRCTVVNGKESFYDETQVAKLGDGATGEDAFYIDLSNGNMTVPYDSSGNNPQITITDVYTYVYAYQGTNQLYIDSITAETIEGIATVTVDGDKVTLNTLGSPSARIRLTVNIGSMSFTKDLWINKVQNGENGFDGVDACYVLISGEQVFKYDKEGLVSPSQITLYASSYGIESPTYSWYWKIVGTDDWNLLENEITETLVVSPNGSYFNNSVNEVTFKVECTSALGGAVYQDMLTINKLYDGKDGESPYRGVLTNEAHTVAANWLGEVESSELAKASTNYYLYQGTRKLENSEYTITYTNLDNNAQNQLSIDTNNNKLTVARLGNSFDSTVFKVEFHVPASSASPVVDVCDFTITKAKGGAPGDFEVSIYCRSNESQPNRPSMTSRPTSGGTYSNGNYWYVDAPSASGYAIWKSTALFDGETGLLKSGEQWTLPTKISGKDGQDGQNGAQGPAGPQGSPGDRGPAGDPGPGLNFRGEYNDSTTYYKTAELVDVVKRNGVYYMANKATITPGWSSSEWKSLNSFENIATGLLFAEEATIGGWRFSPASSSYFRSTNDTVCFYPSTDGSIPFLAAGNGSNKGAISSGGTKIINENAPLKLWADGIVTVGDGTKSSRAGLTGVGTSSDSVRIWAGTNHGNRTSAPFRVLDNGSMVATNGTFTGNVTCTSLIAQNIDSSKFSIPGLKCAGRCNWTGSSASFGYLFTTKELRMSPSRVATGRFRFTLSGAHSTDYIVLCSIDNPTTNINSSFRGSYQMGPRYSDHFDVHWFDTDGSAHDLTYFNVAFFSY